MSVAIVQGASKGIGFSLAKLMAQQTDLKIIATSRNKQTFLKNCELVPGLASRIDFMQLDVTEEGSIQECASLIKSKHGLNSVKYFINSAGYLKPDKSLSGLDYNNALDHFKVNVLGPMMVAKHFAPLLSEPKKTKQKAVWVNISAKTGSIGDNVLGGWYSYRISKAALNQLTKTMSAELFRKGIQVLAIHPGTCDTDLSRKYVQNVQHHIFSPDDAAANIFKVFSESSQNGVFLDYKGNGIPW
ncbi:hypothetical protein BC833DRAFT_605070 [Globomyces pollinis-pini]|nr:hypothetical protein BC833DRAFT_605070 [Globomyces pollinis-pini]